jgi:2,4-diaminopentanoate dehydrogenase
MPNFETPNTGLERKRIRVAHVGIGATGIEALKGIINHPELDLVSLWVTSPDKVGKDAGARAGVPAVGISAVASLEAALAAQPDILCYCGNGLGREKDATEDISTALAQGVDVATISLLGMLYPQAGPSELREPLAQAASAGKSTFLSTGIDPGFSSDVLPLALLTMSDDIEHVLMQEIGIYDHYDVEPVIRHVMGFGQPPTYEAPIASGLFVDYWGGLVRQVAHRLDVALDEIVGTSDYAVHDRDLHTLASAAKFGAQSAPPPCGWSTSFPRWRLHPRVSYLLLTFPWSQAGG